MRSRTPRFVLLIPLLLLAAACETLFNPDPRVNPLADAEVPSQARVESFIGGALPASAQDIYAAEGGFQDTIIWLRFDAPPADVSAFVDSLGVDALTDSSTPPSPAAEADWWQPDAAAQAVGGSYALTERNIFCRVYIDQSNSALWRTYIACNNT